MKEDLSKKVHYAEAVDSNTTQTDNEPKNTQTELSKLQEESKVMSKTINRLEEETVMLRELFNNASSELNNLRKPALLVADVMSVHDGKAIIKLSNGNKFYCFVSPEIKKLNAGDVVLVDQKSLNIISKVDVNSSLEVEKFVIIEKPKESWKEIGGLKDEIREIKEVIELPLKKPHLFKKVGIEPPKGLLLYGPPGTGKTLLAKAAAHSTNATFIEVVGSELVQKFIGEGAKLVKDIFTLARSKAPSIVFIDEIDALAATRMDTGTSGEREVNRTFMQLLAEVDGFEPLDNVKIIGATNRVDILDPAIIRPGRLDRLIQVGLPDEQGRLEILRVHSSKMSLKDVDISKVVPHMENFSGAEIRAVCMEAGFCAIREDRSYVTYEDFMFGIEKVKIEEDEDSEHHKFFG